MLWIHRYGIIILIIEIAGASTVILYGTNLLFNPVVDPLIEDPENPGEPESLSKKAALLKNELATLCLPHSYMVLAHRVETASDIQLVRGS